MKKRLIIIGAIILILVAMWLIYSALNFFTLSLTPKPGNQKASVHSNVEIAFNKEVDPKSTQEFKIEPHVTGKLTLNKNKLVFTPSSGLKLRQTYTVSWKAPRALGGQIAKDIHFSFTTAYIDFKDLSASERSKLVERTDRLEEEHPIVSKLPHEDSHYKIEYSVTSDQNLKLKITLYAILNRPDQYQQYKADAKQYKQEALDFLKDNDADPAKYKIEYVPDPDKL